MAELTRDVIQKIADYCGESLRGGNIVSSREQTEPDGTLRYVVLIDYGIKGLKKLTATPEDLKRGKGAGNRLEDLSLEALKTMAAGMGLVVKKPNKVRMIVAIRQALEGGLPQAEAEEPDEPPLGEESDEDE